MHIYVAHVRAAGLEKIFGADLSRPLPDLSAAGLGNRLDAANRLLGHDNFGD
jgi:hypothetical protein